MSASPAICPLRAYEHREGLIEGFTKRHGLKRLVYVEHFDDIRYAIQREKTIKHWPRAWKVRLIHGAYPKWDDLYGALIQYAVMPALVAGIHVFRLRPAERRGWPNSPAMTPWGPRSGCCGRQTP